NRETCRIDCILEKLDGTLSTDALFKRGVFGAARLLQQNCLNPPGGSLRSVAKHAHRKDTADQHSLADSANVCTSRARAPGFFARKARTSPSRLARSVGASSQQCCRSWDG